MKLLNNRKVLVILLAIFLLGGGYFLLNRPSSVFQNQESDQTSVGFETSSTSSLFANIKTNLPSDKIVVIEDGKLTNSYLTYYSPDYYKDSLSKSIPLFDHSSITIANAVTYMVILKDLINVPKTEFYSYFSVLFRSAADKTLAQVKSDFTTMTFSNLSDKPDLKEDFINGHKVLIVRFYALPFRILILSQSGNDVEILSADFNLNPVQGKLNKNSSKSQMDMYEAYLKSLIAIDSNKTAR